MFMKKFTTLVAVAAMAATSATSAMAGSPAAAEDDPYIEPVVPVGSSAGSLGGGAGLVIAGVAAAALIGVALSDSDSTGTTTP